MFTGSNGQVVLVVLLGAVLVLAGCSSGPTANATANGTTTVGTATTDVPTTSGSGSDGPTVAGYEWSENESYTFEDRGGNTFVFSVESVENDTVTVNFTAVRRGQTTSRTITGEQGRFFRSLDEGDRSKFGFFAFVYDGRLAVGGHDLTVGNTWTGTDDGSQYQVEVTGNGTAQGQQCYNLRIESNSGTLRPCVKKTWPLSLSATGTGSQGLTIQFNMTDYHRP